MILGRIYHSLLSRLHKCFSYLAVCFKQQEIQFPETLSKKFKILSVTKHKTQSVKILSCVHLA